VTGVLAIVQARCSSSRLPGKVLAPVEGEPMIMRQLERIARARMLDEVVIATSVHESDDALAFELERRGYAVRRGPLADVLERFMLVVDEFTPQHVVRLTGDCPLTDPDVIDLVVASHLVSGADYTSNALERTFPHGLDVEAMKASALSALRPMALNADEHEHVTLGIYSRSKDFILHSVRQGADSSNLRWTVDYPADLDFVRAVYEEFLPRNPQFTTADVLEWVGHHPEKSRTSSDVS